MHFIEIKEKGDPRLDAALALLEEAFPPQERRDRDEQLRILSKKDYRFTVAVKNGTLVGLLLYWEVGELLFLEHLATRQDLRGRGYGAAALAHLKSKARPILLEIEPPVDDLTTRRRGFYRRNGFVPAPHHHIQVKYHPGDPDLRLDLLCYPTPITAEAYQAFKTYMHREIAFGC